MKKYRSTTATVVKHFSHGSVGGLFGIIRTIQHYCHGSVFTNDVNYGHYHHGNHLYIYQRVCVK